jgi:hypothetical protein
MTPGRNSLTTPSLDRVNRAVARRVRDIDVQHQVEAYRATTQVRLAAYQADALAAFTGHAMERAVEVDMTRRALAGEDPALNALLGRLEYNFVRRVEGMQNRLFDGLSY